MTTAPAMEFASDVPSHSAVSSAQIAPTKRVMSVDALRGFDMFWIIGGDAIAGGLARMFPDAPWAKVVREQFTGHVDWGTKNWRDLIEFKGIHFYDLIFPLFVFIVGVSLVFSLTKQIAQGGKAKAVRRIILRSILLFCMGIIINGGLSNPWPNVRIMGVLQRIALCYLVAGLLFTYFSTRTLVIVSVSLLVVYWAIMSFIPVPHQGYHSFDEGKNLSDWIDSKALPGKKYVAQPIPHDPEGFLSTMPAVVTCLLGVFAGLLLRNGQQEPWKKGALLILCGIAAAGLGLLWGMQFPVIKKIWTSSYVLFAGGCSSILLGVFYLVIDVANFRIWARPFVWIGMNAILCYMLFDGNIIPLRGGHQNPDGTMQYPAPLCERLMGGSVRHFLDARHAGLANFVIACLAMLIMLAIVRFLYKRQIFLRV